MTTPLEQIRKELDAVTTGKCVGLAMTPFCENAPTYLAALLDIAEAAQDAITDCQLSPDEAQVAGAKRRWCVNHQEWAPCSIADLKAALRKLPQRFPEGGEL